MDIRIERTSLNPSVVNQLPDGSRVLVDSSNGMVFALNSLAGAAWDACQQPTTLSRITDQLRSSSQSQVTEELARQAIVELEEHKLVTTSGDSMPLTRRRIIGAMGSALALPLVVSLTLADQRAYAGQASSSQWSHGPKPKPRWPPPNWW
jgi:hypothetical protein